ncbi:MAG: hypothetical protein J6K73_03275 [Clostridia bacterium]|nr:hypothetical protein [Clostridia bacterium]
MKNLLFHRVFALLVVLCMLLCSVSVAENQANADLEALYPLMDLVCAAGYDPTAGTALVVPDSEGVLEISFVDAFIRLGQARGVLGITGETMSDPAAQTALLQSVFAAQLPQTELVVATDVGTQYVGFKPVTVNNTGDAGSLQIVGEMYMAPKAIGQLAESDFSQVLWIDRAIFTFKSDASALNGFRLVNFSTGLELSVEEEMQAYSESIVVEYVNTNLGFMVLYPSVFTDDLLVEDANGVSAALPDNSVSFFARRTENTAGNALADHVAAVATELPGAVVDVNEELSYATVSYTADGYAVFDVYVVTKGYVYQTQLRYLTTLMSEYSMYNGYLLNSFGVDELAAG